MKDKKELFVNGAKIEETDKSYVNGFRLQKTDKKFGETVVNGVVMGLYDREEKHQLGQDNGQPDSWWLLYNMGESTGLPEWVPWIDIGSNRTCWDISLRTENRSKYKWNSTRITGNGWVDIKCNQRVVYSFPFRDIEYGLARVTVLITEMMEHSFNFCDPESELGRKIWYHEQPAIIERLILSQGAIIVKFDGLNELGGFNLRKPWETQEDRDADEWHGQSEVKTNILDPKIWWHRDGKVDPAPNKNLGNPNLIKTK